MWRSISFRYVLFPRYLMSPFSWHKMKCNEQMYRMCNELECVNFFFFVDASSMLWKSKFFVGYKLMTTHIFHTFLSKFEETGAMLSESVHNLHFSILHFHLNWPDFVFHINLFSKTNDWMPKGTIFFRISKRVKLNDNNKIFIVSFWRIQICLCSLFPRSAFETIKWFVFSVWFSFAKQTKKSTRNVIKNQSSFESFNHFDSLLFNAFNEILLHLPYASYF